MGDHASRGEDFSFSLVISPLFDFFFGKETSLYYCENEMARFSVPYSTTELSRHFFLFFFFVAAFKALHLLVPYIENVHFQCKGRIVK
jgi:hypothetical protein